MKQRLIGTLVLVCLALIFIPMLLDGEGIRPPAMNLDFPPPPRIDTPDFTEPVRPALVEDTIVADAPSQPQLDLPPFVAEETPDAIAADQAQTDGATAPAANEPPAVAPAPAEPTPAPAVAAPSAEQVPAIDAAGLPEGWVVRLGLFGERRNADKLLNDLLAADYKAYLEPVATAQGRMNGVFVGPLATRAEAGALQQELKSRFKLDGMVSRFSLDTSP
ncbi:MAG TPA: SPOR domain-containing protein [Hyphomicrobiales bacterium]|nr:SPOR domain-containing protein [Hyphomicrobiales bacterium]